MNRGKRYVRYAANILAVTATAFLLAFFAVNFVIFNARVPTSSMRNTIMPKDRLIGNRLAYYFSTPKRGDIIIFKHRCYDNQPVETLVKRVIGLPGDYIELKRDGVYINGVLQFEEYAALCEYSEAEYEIPSGCYFVMGDNRPSSADSRYWDSPYISFDEIEAKVCFKYFPKIKLLT